MNNNNIITIHSDIATGIYEDVFLNGYFSYDCIVLNNMYNGSFHAFINYKDSPTTFTYFLDESDE